MTDIDETELSKPYILKISKRPALPSTSTEGAMLVKPLEVEVLYLAPEKINVVPKKTQIPLQRGIVSPVVHFPINAVMLVVLHSAVCQYAM